MKTHHEKARKYFTLKRIQGEPISEICDNLRLYYKKHGDYFNSYIISWWGLK